MRRAVKAKLKPQPPPPQEQERTYTTREVMSICDVTPRQLQWWDEEGMVSPRIADHKRLYTPAEVMQVSVAAELRSKGLRMALIRRSLRDIAEAFRKTAPAIANAQEVLALIRPGKTYLEVHPERVIERMKEEMDGVFVIGIVHQDGLRLAARSDSRSPVSGLHRANGVSGSKGNRGRAMGGGAR